MNLLRSSAPRLLSLLTVSSVLACGGSRGADEGASQESSALRALLPAEIVGAIAPGETKSVLYSNPPEYRAFTITAVANQRLDVWVRSTEGNPRAWLLGSQYETLTYNYDASPTDRNSHLVFTTPTAGTYYVVFRDEAYEDATFTVSAAADDHGCAAGASCNAGACTTDTECGGGSAMCFLGSCMTVSEETRSMGNGTHGSVYAAYDPSDALHVAYAYIDPTTQSGYKYFVAEGPWTAPTKAAGGFWSDPHYSVWHRRGAAPLVTYTANAASGGYAVVFGDTVGLTTGRLEQIRGFTAARSESGTDFVAATVLDGSSSVTKCDLRFASRPSGGAWSAPVSLGNCAWIWSLALHVRQGGATADVIAGGSGGPGIVVYRRTNPIDPWSATTIVPTDLNAGSQVIGVQSHDGTSHLVLTTWTFGSDSSRGDYVPRYAAFSDSGITRDVALGAYARQAYPPFESIDVGTDGTAYALKATRGGSYVPEVVRITAAGEMTSRALGAVSSGSWPSDSLAVSSTGEIALIHTADLRTLQLRRFTPVAH